MTTDAKILDFGCGDGFYSINFSKIFPQLCFWGCDISRAMIEKAYRANRIEGTNFCLKHTEGIIPFDDRFHIII